MLPHFPHVEKEALKDLEELKVKFIQQAQSSTQSAEVKEVYLVTEREWRKLVGMYSTIVDFDF